MTGPIPTPSRPERAQDLDLFKTLLVVPMIAVHVIQLLTYLPRIEARLLSDYASLVSFSGFLFAFGMGLGLPKSGGRARSRSQQLRPTLLLLLAVYVSSFGFALLFTRTPLSATLVIDVLTMRRLFGWSEFLASFFTLSLAMLAARPALLAIGRNGWQLVGVSALCLWSTTITTDALVPLLPTLIGHRGFPTFPLLPYLPWFLLGIWYGSRPLRGWQLLPALAASGWLVWFVLHHHELPQRFPPSIVWIVAPAAALLAYLGVCRWLARRMSLPRVVLTPGRHLLSFVVVSNIGLFAMRYLLNRTVRSALVVLVVIVAMLVGLTGFWWVVDGLRMRRRGADSDVAPDTLRGDRM